MRVKQVDMTGKTCVVTGANSGIGRATVEALAGMGAAVVLVCRDVARGEQALESVRKQTGNENLDLKVADLASQQAVRRLADDLLADCANIDVLINNAAVVPAKRETTEDGIEKQFAVNHLAPFLLTNLLLDRLKASAPSRVITVSSTMHNGAQMNWDDLQFENGYSAFKAYGHSKLANVLFTVELARRTSGTGVTVNTLHPGGVRTNIMRHTSAPIRAVAKLAGPLMLSPAKGAEPVVYVATSPDVGNLTGQYFHRRKLAMPSREASDPDSAERLWTISAELTGIGPTAA